MENLSICQACKKNPAVYGDGLTWSRCSACQLQDQQQAETIPVNQESISTEGFDHPNIPGLVSIIMPVYMKDYSLFHYTGNAIGSMRQFTDREKYEFIVIDNGSPIPAPELKSFYADKVIQNDKNTGVTFAWNQGIRASFGEYIVLLENDVLVYEGWLEGLKKYLDDGTADLVMAHPMYSLTEPFARATESKKVLEGTKTFDKLQGESDFSCVMFKKSLYDEIGPFDEQFFSYCSDIDYLRRMKEAGKKYMIVDSVATTHFSNATGYVMGVENNDIMDEDKRKFSDKYSRPQPASEAEKPGDSQAASLNLVRSDFTGDRVFLIKDNQTHWVKNPETLGALGGDLGREVIMKREDFNKFTKGEDIDMENVSKYK